MIASKIEKATYKFTLECIYLLDSNFYFQPGGKRISSIYFHNNKGVYFATTSSVCYYCTLAIPLIKTSPTPVYLHCDDLVVSIPTLINWVCRSSVRVCVHFSQFQFYLGILPFSVTILEVNCSLISAVSSCVAYYPYVAFFSSTYGCIPP